MPQRITISFGGLHHWTARARPAQIPPTGLQLLQLRHGLPERRALPRVPLPSAPLISLLPSRALIRFKSHPAVGSVTHGTAHGTNCATHDPPHRGVRGHGGAARACLAMRVRGRWPRVCKAPPALPRLGMALLSEHPMCREARTPLISPRAHSWHNTRRWLSAGALLCRRADHTIESLEADVLTAPARRLAPRG